MQTNFASILSKTAASAEKPKPLPAGTFNLLITKHEFGESQQKKTPYVRFYFSIQAPGQDVDMAALAGIDLTKKTLRDDFYLTDDALYRLRDFMEKSLGMEIGVKSFSQLIPECVGRPVIGSVKQVPSQKPNDDTIYNEIEGYALAA